MGFLDDPNKIEGLIKSNTPVKTEKKDQPTIKLFLADPNSTPLEELKGSNQEKLSKSILRFLNGNTDDPNTLSRLAFEADPDDRNNNGALYEMKLRLLPDDILKRIAIQDDLVAAIVNTRAKMMASFGRPQPDRYSTGYKVVPMPGIVEGIKDSEKKKRFLEDIKEVERRIATCGGPVGWDAREKHMSFSQFLSMTARDAVVVGRIACEMLYSKDMDTDKRKFRAFRPMDAGTIYKAARKSQDELATVRESAQTILNELNGHKAEPVKDDPKEYDWVQVIQGRVRQSFTDEQCAVHNFYPVTDVKMNGYPVTPLDTIINAVTTHINIGEFNKLYFSSGRGTKGMLVIQSDSVDDTTLLQIKQQFNASINSVQNCLDGSVQVWTKEFGGLSLKEIIEDKKEQKVTIWTGKEWEPAEIYKTNQKPLNITYLRNSIDVKSSPDHKFQVIGDNGDPTWKKQSELQVGDYLLVNKESVSNSDNVPNFCGQPINEGLMEILGWVTGDGSIDHGRFKLFYHHEKEFHIQPIHLEILKNFGLQPYKEIKHLTEEERVRICERYGFKSCADTRISNILSSVKFTNWYQELGFHLSRDGKVIPAFLYTLPEKLKCAFLRGFFSADGDNEYGHNPKATITYPELREGIKKLLLTIGIRTNKSEGKKKVTIDGPRRNYVEAQFYLRIKDKYKFMEKVGFIQEHKQEKPLKNNNLKDKTHWISKSSIIKYSKLVKEYADKHDVVLSKQQRADLNAVCRGSDACSLTRLFRIMNSVGYSPPEWMVRYNFEPITKIEVTNTLVDMYDVTIVSNSHKCIGLDCQEHNKHAFMANGISTHNSHRTPLFALSTGDSVQWVQMDSARDMEFQYLSDANARTILSSFQISPEEVPGCAHLSRGTNASTLSESKNEFVLTAARDVGLRPLMSSFEDFINGRIMPLIAPKLAKVCVFKFLGLDALDEEKESIRIQEDQGLHMTYDEVLGRVEKKPIGLPWGGEYPLNPQMQAVMEKFLTKGQLLKRFFGIEDADDAQKHPEWAYCMQDPTSTQIYLAKSQMDLQIQAQQSMPQQDQNPQQNQGQQQQTDPNAVNEIKQQIGQVISALSKSEKNLPDVAKELLAKQTELVDSTMNSWEEDAKKAKEEASRLLGQFLPKKKE